MLISEYMSSNLHGLPEGNSFLRVTIGERSGSLKDERDMRKIDIKILVLLLLGQASHKAADINFTKSLS